MSHLAKWSDVIILSVVCSCFTIVNLQELSHGGLYSHSRVYYGWPAMYAWGHPMDLPLVWSDSHPYEVDGPVLVRPRRQYRAAMCPYFSRTSLAIDVTVAVVSVVCIAYISRRRMRHEIPRSGSRGAIVAFVTVTGIVVFWQLFLVDAAMLAQLPCAAAVFVSGVGVLWSALRVSLRVK